MKTVKKHIGYLFMLAAVCSAASILPSCEGVLDHYPVECNYTVQLIYHYNLENTSETNQFGRYVRSTEEYIFDGDGILVAVNPLRQDACTGEWVSKVMLDPGRYSVIAVGNRTAMSSIHAGGAEPKIGVTRREDMTLTLENLSADGSDDGIHYNSIGRLYYGYRTFTVEPTGTGNIRVDMVHSHLDLTYTIRWKGGAAPANTGDFHVRLMDVPSEYNLMPEYVHTEPGTCEEHDADTHDEYNSTCLDVRHHIAGVGKTDNVINHRQNSMQFGNAVPGQVLSYRLRNKGDGRTDTMISLWYTDITRSGEPEQLMKDIHLNDFLNRSNVDLDRTLKQQFHIVFEIDPRTGQVDVGFADIADWDEGGSI